DVEPDAEPMHGSPTLRARRPGAMRRYRPWEWRMPRAESIPDVSRQADQSSHPSAESTRMSKKPTYTCDRARRPDYTAWRAGRGSPVFHDARLWRWKPAASQRVTRAQSSLCRESAVGLVC